MMEHFEFATAARIIVGRGTLHNLTRYLNGCGKKNVFVVTGGRNERAAPVIELLNEYGMKYTIFNVCGEPTIDHTWEGVQQARQISTELVIGIGGGSVLDTGKVISAMLTNSGELIDYLEVIGKGKKLQNSAVPYVAIPTTAGTGTEVTKNAVLRSQKYKVKVSMRSKHMLPWIALVDAALADSMPPHVTASTGLDAITQLIEAYVSHKANPLTDGICKEGLRLAAPAILRAYKNGNDQGARNDMACASLFGGLALANAKLGAVHGFASVIGGMYDAPHGTICAALLPFVMKTNITALQKREPESPALKRFDEIAHIVTGQAGAGASDGIAWIRQLCEALHIPPLRAIELHRNDIADVVRKSMKASSMKGNPVELTEDELTQILAEAL